MKILQVADVSGSRIIGGAERFLSCQSAALVKRGHQVSVMTRIPEGYTEFLAQDDGITEFRYRVNSANPATFLFSTMRNGKRLFESLYRRYRLDAINFHQPFSALAVCRSPAARGILKIYTCHSLSFEEYISRNPRPTRPAGHTAHMVNIFGRKIIERHVMNRCEKIVALSRYTTKKLRNAHGIDPARMEIIPGGVDLIRFSPTEDSTAIRDGLNIPGNGIFLFTVRNLVRRMGLENLIKAVAMVRKSVPEIFLVIGGTGPLRRGLESLTLDFGVTDCIRFEGFIAEERLPDYYRAADLFVLPTRELEGFGLVTLEAMASGTPVAGTPVGGTAEILGEFDRLFLFEDTSAEAIAALLARLCSLIKDDPAAWKDISTRCRAFVEKRYSWDTNISAMEKIMKKEISDVTRKKEPGCVESAES